MRALLAATLLLAASGCDQTSLDPFVRDAPPYSLYGTVVADGVARIQQVRIQHIRATAAPLTDAADEVDLARGRMTSPDPQTGEPMVWTPRTVTFDDGTVGTVFEREFRPLPDSRFEIRYEDPEGRVVTAEVVTPPQPPATLFEPVLVDAAEGNYRQRIVWEGVRFLPEAILSYHGGTLEDGSDGYSVAVPLRDLGDGRVELDIDLSAGLRRLAELVPVDDGGFIPDLKVRARVTSLTDRIPPDDVVPTDAGGRAFVQGSTVNTVAWVPQGIRVYSQ